MELANLKKVSLADLTAFLRQDHTNFSVLNVRLKSILSTGRTSITLSKNSAKSFYLNSKPTETKELAKSAENSLPADCLKDAQNCQFFKFFSSQEKKLYLRFLDKAEANFEGTEAQQPLLFLTLTFNTTQNNYQAFTSN
jgi:hypothetical protein